MKDLSIELNMNLSKKVVLRTAEMTWEGSRSEGVLRKPLEREFSESGRTTSIVQFIAGANFPPHRHPMGEEIFVLEGVFSDETGDYPAGTYIRNPPGSIHAPFSKEGCVIFVKLEQFSEQDNQRVILNTREVRMEPGQGNLKVLSLHSIGSEHSALVFWPKGEIFVPHKHWGGEEIFVIEGEFIDEHDRYPKYTWIRSPHLSQHLPYVEFDTLIYVKTGHL